MLKFLKLLPYLLIVFLFFRISYLNKQNIRLKNKTATLEENLKKKTIIYKDKIIFKEREVTGTNIKQETFYIPSEGKVEILNPKDDAQYDLILIDKIFNKVIRQEDGTILLIKNKGFSIAPEVSIMLSSELEVGGQLKLLYWSRYSSGVGFSDKQTLYGYISRNISDIFNFTKNTSVQLAIGKNFKEQETRFLLGVNVRL
jgi:hypothetical protein